jgi:glyoxylase-like metal-dependent hydrolase (beta-lactamase superfamily II)
VLWIRYHPNLEDWDYEGWLKTLDMVKALDAQRIIPGHGPIAGPEELELFGEYLKRFHDRIAPKVMQNLKKDDLIQLLGLEVCREWKMSWILERNLRQLHKADA